MGNNSTVRLLVYGLLVSSVLVAGLRSAQGEVSFNAGRSFAAGGSPAAVAVGDFNGDGLLDLAVANRGSNDVSILLGQGDGTFQAPQAFIAGVAPVSVAVGDFNGDGLLDLAVPNGTFLGTVSILLGQDDGTF